MGSRAELINNSVSRKDGVRNGRVFVFFLILQHDIYLKKTWEIRTGLKHNPFGLLQNMFVNTKSLRIKFGFAFLFFLLLL